MGYKNWLGNKKLFEQERAKGWKWESVVAGILTDMGYSVEIPDHFDYEPNCDESKQTHDMLVNGKIVEVKSRNLEFIGIDSFPYPSIFVKTKATYDKMVNKPAMCVCISQKTGACVALDVEKTSGSWRAVRFFDRIRKINTTAYECDIGLWETLGEVARRVIGSSCQTGPGHAGGALEGT